MLVLWLELETGLILLPGGSILFVASLFPGGSILFVASLFPFEAYYSSLPFEACYSSLPFQAYYSSLPFFKMVTSQMITSRGLGFSKSSQNCDLRCALHPAPQQNTSRVQKKRSVTPVSLMIVLLVLIVLS